MKKRIAVLFGGEGVEYEVSRLGAECLSQYIDRELFDTVSVEISRQGDWYLTENGERLPVYPARVQGDSGLILNGALMHVDAVFPLLHGEMGEDGNVQGALRTAKLPFVGCTTLSGAIASDKIVMKAVARALGIAVARDVSLFERDPEHPNVERARELAEREIGYPMFIKPSGLGSSVGAAAVFDRESFSDIYSTASRLGLGRILIEEYVSPRRELECAWFEYTGGVFISEPAEIKCEASFYSYDEKYGKDSTVKLIPRADIPQSISSAARLNTARLAEFIGCRDLCRADFFLAGDRLVFNEINTMPGMTKASLWLRLAEGTGLSKTEIVTELLRSAISRL